MMDNDTFRLSLINMNQLYCKIFVQGASSRDALLDILVTSVAGERRRTGLTTSLMEIDIRKNDDHDAERARASDFLHFQFFLDVEPIPGVVRERYIREVSVLLKSLWAKGILAVAACPFEDELPQPPSSSV